MAGPGNIIISVGVEAAKAVSGLNSVNDALDQTSTRGSRMASGLKKAAIPAAAALGALGVAAVKFTKAAMEDQAVSEHFVTAIKNTTNATDEQVASLQDYINKTELATGVSDDQLAPALETLARATGNTTDAQKLMNVALDVSAATGKDVETVSDAMAKAHSGQTGALAKLVPGLSKAAIKSKDFNVILAELAKTTGGAMASASDTAQGKMARFSASTDQLTEALGYTLLPIVESIIPLLMRLAQFAQENTKVITILAGVVATLSAGILVANAAMKIYAAAQTAIKVATAAWTAAQWLLNVALNANPIGLITVAIAALAAGIVIAYKHSETFRTIVHDALHAVMVAADALKVAFNELVAAARAAFDWIVGHWKVAMFAFGPLGAAIGLIALNWDKVSGAAQAAAGAMKAAIDAVVGAIQAVAGAVDGAVHAIGRLTRMTSAIHAVTGALESALYAVERLIGALGRIHVPDIHLPHIPGLNAYAYPVGGPTVAPAGYRAGSSSSSPGVTVNVYGAVDPEGTARAIRRILDAHDRRQGRAISGALA